MTVGVVGAGITGLSASYYFEQADLDHVVFEEADRPGGVIRTSHVNGRVLECGPQRGRMSPTLRAIIDEAGAADEVIEADGDMPLYVYADGKLREVPFDVKTFLTTDLLSWPGKLRVLAEPLTADGDEDEIAADLFSRKFGEEAYRNFIGPIFGGTYGSDPGEMYAKYALSRILEFEKRKGSLLVPAIKRATSESRAPAFSFRDGMARLPEAMYDLQREHVRLETPVEAITEDGDGYVLATPDGDHEVTDVVLTTPADVTADLVRDIDPESAAALDSLNYNSMVLVHLDADVDADGMGYQIRHDEPYKTLGVTWHDSLFDRTGVYTVFLGGMKNPDLIRESDEELGRIAQEEFADVMGVASDVINVERLERGFPAYDRSWTATEDVDLPDGLHIAANFTTGAGIPTRIHEAKGLADRLG
ncbi:protoporphyrinogen oxidase [Halobacteriaceae archaeon GCM10025711]